MALKLFLVFFTNNKPLPCKPHNYQEGRWSTKEISKLLFKAETRALSLALINHYEETSNVVLILPLLILLFFQPY